MPDPKVPRIAVYVRVSTDEQAREGFSLEDQQAQCLQKLDEEYGPNLYEADVFIDDGYSGRLGLYDPARPSKPHRPALTRLKQALDAGQFDAVCIHRLDRLSRSYSLLPQLFEEVFGKGDVKLISVREFGMDVTTPTGRYIAHTLNQTSALYAEISGQNVRDASLLRRRSGYPIKIALGWRWKAERDPNGRRGIERDPEQGETVTFVVNSFLAGMGSRTIAQALLDRGIKTAKGTDRWYRKLVTDILLQPLNYGLIRIGEEEFVPGAHFEERYFDPEVREQVVQQCRSRTGESLKYDMTPRYLLIGVAHCGHCGVRMRGRRGRGVRRAYECQAEPWQKAPECGRINTRADWVEEEVMEYVWALVRDPETLEHARREALNSAGGAVSELEADKRRVEAELQTVRKRFTTWSDRFSDDLVTQEEYTEYLAGLRTRRAELEGELAEIEAALQARTEAQDRREEVDRALANIGTLWDRMTGEERQDVVRQVVERVTITANENGDRLLNIELHGAGVVQRVIPNLKNLPITPRQMEVLWLVGQGHSRRDVARRLGQTVEGLNCTLTAARRRLGVDTAQEAVKTALPIIRPVVKWLDLEGRAQRLPGQGGKWPTLGDEERKVLGLLAEGLSGPEIARRLDKQPNTVYAQLHVMRRKLGAADNRQLLTGARRAGVV